MNIATRQKSIGKIFYDSAFHEKNGLNQLDYDYRELIEGLPAAIYTCDVTGRITFYNQAAVKLWGREPVIGKDLWCGSWKIYKTDNTPLPTDEFPMAISLKEYRAIKCGEIIIERPDGTRVNVLPQPKPIFNSDGKIIGAINMLVDITEKKKDLQRMSKSKAKNKHLSETLEKEVDKRTRALMKSEERYHKMIEEVQDYAILLLDKDGNILNWNKGAAKIKGYTEDEIIGKNFNVFYLDKDREAKLPEKLIKQAIDFGKAMHEGWRKRKDGTHFWGSIVITALHDQYNNIIGFSKVTRDLTERKLAEDERNRFTRSIEFQNKQLQEYAYVASHDLQEPLRKMQTFVTYLLKNTDDKTAVNLYAERINLSAKRMAALIKDILKYSRLSKNTELFEPVDLNKVIEMVMQDYDLLLEEKHAVINYKELPVIRAIPVQMQQLFSNLINNALKYSIKTPVIDISSEKLLHEEVKKYNQLNSNFDYVKITFRDNGPGFDPGYSEKVFELFKRLNDKLSGTGIGLATCKKIVENHEGHISVKTKPGKGTVFTIFLPD